MNRCRSVIIFYIFYSYAWLQAKSLYIFFVNDILFHIVCRQVVYMCFIFSFYDPHCAQANNVNHKCISVFITYLFVQSILVQKLFCNLILNLNNTHFIFYIYITVSVIANQSKKRKKEEKREEQSSQFVLYFYYYSSQYPLSYIICWTLVCIEVVFYARHLRIDAHWNK